MKMISKTGKPVVKFQAKKSKIKDINCYIFSSVKETNWLINKGMCVLLYDVFKHLQLRKTYVFKTCQKSKFLRKKI